MADKVFPRLVSILKSNGFVLYEEPYQLNIVAIRSKSTVPNRFDDELHVFFKDGLSNKWKYSLYPVTTDPGTYYLGTRMGTELGTAILPTGQYVNSHSLGMHKGQYTALVATRPLPVLRDYDRDSVLDFENGKPDMASGINIHRASSNGTTVDVGAWSAGCTVFANADQFNEFIKLCRLHEARHGNQFTYTLIDFRAERKETLKRLGIIGGLVMLALGAVAILTDTDLEDLFSPSAA